MKRLLSILLSTLLSLTALYGQPRFRADSTFKVVQFTDLHLSWKFQDECDAVYKRIETIVGTENPDFIAITGDLVFGKPARPAIEKLVGILDSFGIPWAVTYGNHDAEQDLSRPEMSALYAAGRNSVNRLNDAGELADIEIPVLFGGVPSYYIYMLDSHDYPQDRTSGKYAWFTPAQISWFSDCCAARKEEGKAPVPSVAFFHIPLAEYVDAWCPMDNPRMGFGDRKHCIGMRGESIACGGLNTGMFAAMKLSGSIVATFCGHDHDSDFLACYRGIALCYGRFSGCNTVYNNIPRGARVVVLKPGSREFETWIRDDDGRVIWHATSDGNEVRHLGNRPKGGLYGQWCDK